MRLITIYNNHSRHQEAFSDIKRLESHCNTTCTYISYKLLCIQCSCSGTFIIKNISQFDHLTIPRLLRMYCSCKLYKGICTIVMEYIYIMFQYQFFSCLFQLYIIT